MGHQQSCAAVELNPIKVVHNLVFSVGSIRGLAFVQAYATLKEYRSVAEVRGLAGSSAGALMCLALALGFEPREMLPLFEEPWFIRTPWCVDLDSCGRLSLMDTEGLRGAMKNMFIAKGVDPGVRFQEFAPAVDLRIIAYNITRKKRQVFSRQTTPNARVLDAVLASCSMPVFMPPVRISNECFSDGFLVDNFPIDEFPAADTLGFYLFDSFRSENPHFPSHHVICIDVSRLGFLQFNPPPALRSWVLQQGEKAVRRYFSSVPAQRERTP